MATIGEIQRKIERGVARDLRSLKGKRAKPTIPKHVRDEVWRRYIGMDKAEGKCYVCGRTIHITDFEVGHNRAVSKGGSDKVTNLRPICKGCNRSMGTMSIEAFKRKYFLKSKKKTARKIKRKRPKTPLERLTKQVRKDFLG